MISFTDFTSKSTQILTFHFVLCSKLQAKRSTKLKSKEMNHLFLQIVPHNISYCYCVVCFLEELQTCRHHNIENVFSFLAPKKGRNMNSCKTSREIKEARTFQKKMPTLL